MFEVTKKNAETSAADNVLYECGGKESEFKEPSRCRLLNLCDSKEGFFRRWQIEKEDDGAPNNRRKSRISAILEENKEQSTRQKPVRRPKPEEIENSDSRSGAKRHAGAETGKSRAVG